MLDRIRPDDTERLVSIVSQAFGYPGVAATWLDRVDRSNVRVWRQHGQVDGTLVCIPMGQWFGGRRVP